MLQPTVTWIQFRNAILEWRHLQTGKLAPNVQPASVVFDDIPVLPRVGEMVDIPYFRDKVNCDSFYVASITHSYPDKDLHINITCKGGMYNKYWHIRKDEAYMKGELSIDDYFAKDEYAIRKRLRLDPYV